MTFRTGSPAGYQELRERFENKRDLATALMVSPRLLSAWERGDQTRIKSCPQRRINRLLAALAKGEADGRVNDPVEWLLSAPEGDEEPRVRRLHRKGIDALG